MVFEKVTLTLPKDLMDTVREMAPPRSYSKFIAEAIRFYTETKRRQALRSRLVAGYQANASADAALAADSHVLTEKPGCVKLEDFERVVRLAEQKKRQVMLAMATRSSAAVKKARRLIADGLLGKPYSATMDWIADQTRLKSPAYHQSWLSFKDRAGGDIACAIEEHVERAGLGDHGGNGIGVGNIQLRRRDAVDRRQIEQRLCVDIAGQDRGAFGGEPFGAGAADPLRSRGHERSFSRQTLHMVVSFPGALRSG